MKFFSCLFVLLISTSIYGQVKIGNNPNTIDTSSLLELESTTKTFVLTRVTNAEMNSITPLIGALVYNTDAQCIFQFTGTWNSLCNTGSDDQTLSFDPNTNILTLEDGGTVDLSLYINTDDQQISLAGNILTLEDGGTVDLSGYLDNTDNQNITAFSLDNATNILTITLENGNTQTVDLSALQDGTGTDDQQISLAGNILTLEDGGTVDLSGYLDNTDDQQITDFSLSGTTLTLTLEDGGTRTVDIAGIEHTGTTGSVFFASATGTPTEDNTNLFWNDANNRLGIGTASPTSTLHVMGDINIGGSDTRLIRFRNAADNDHASIGILNGGLVLSGHSQATNAGDEHIFIKNGGNVGIGTINPNEKLNVNGNAIIGSNNVDATLNGQGTFQANSDLNNAGFIATPWVYARAIEGDQRGGAATMITLGGQNGFTNNDQIGFITNGQQRMLVDTNGNVGIGITSPSEKLDVNGIAQLGNTGATNGVVHMIGKYSGNNHLNIYGSEFSSGATVIGYATQPKSGTAGYVSSAQNVSLPRGILKNDGNLQFLTASSALVNIGTDIVMTPRFTVLNGGNVGIGTTSPSAKLEVAGQIKITGGTPGAGKVLTSDANGLATWQAISSGADSDWTISGNNQYSAVSGNVGIGTNSPNYKLSVATTTGGAVWQQFSNADSGASSTDGFYLGMGAGEDAFVWNAENTALRFYTNNQEKMRISNAGNVGIGTSSPNYKLDVRENSTANGIGTQEAISISSTVAGNATSNYGIYANTSPTATGTVANNYSIFGDVNLPSGGNATNTYGVFGRSLISGTVSTNTFGVYGSSDVLSGGTVTNAIEGGRFAARARSGATVASAYGILSTAQHEGILTDTNYGTYSIAQPLAGSIINASNFAAYNYAGIPVGGIVNENNYGTYSNADIFGTVTNNNFGSYSIARVRGGVIGSSNYGVYAHTGHIGGTISGSNYGVFSYTTGDAASTIGTNNFGGYFNASQIGTVANDNFGVYSISRTRNGGTIGGNNYAGYFHAAATNNGGGGYGTIAGNNFGVRIIMSTNGVAGTTWGIYQTGDAGTENYFQNTVGIGTTSGAGILNVNGVATKTGGGVWAVFSDRRSKENIKNYTKGLAELLQLRPVSFNYKKSFGFGNNTHVGFIAQEVEKVVPSMVTKTDMYGFKDFRQVDANEVTFMLINAVKKLTNENEALKSENESIKNRLEALEKAIQKLQKD